MEVSVSRGPQHRNHVCNMCTVCIPYTTRPTLSRCLMCKREEIRSKMPSAIRHVGWPRPATTRDETAGRILSVASFICASARLNAAASLADNNWLLDLILAPRTCWTCTTAPARRPRRSPHRAPHASCGGSELRPNEPMTRGARRHPTHCAVRSRIRTGGGCTARTGNADTALGDSRARHCS